MKKIKQLKYLNAVNALAPPPELYGILQSIQLTDDKYDAGMP